MLLAGIQSANPDGYFQKLIAGSLPKRQQRFVEAWGELHKDELLKDWDLLKNGRLPFPIELIK